MGVRGLKPGGVLVLEGFSKEQLSHDTGGPQSSDMLMSRDDFKQDLVGLEYRPLGRYFHTGTMRDFVAAGTGLAENSMDAALLFNILHHEEPVALMKEAFRVLKPNGMLAVIHWNYDPATPRGPAMEIRPRPEQCIAWGQAAGFLFNEQNRYDLPPYHYGLLFRKPST